MFSTFSDRATMMIIVDRKELSAGGVCYDKHGKRFVSSIIIAQ
jgi:hypothetical protein